MLMRATLFSENRFPVMEIRLRNENNNATSPAMKQSLRSLLAVTARAAGREGRSRQQRSLPGGKSGHAPKRRLPESGYFADVDPKSVGEVSPALSFVEKTDINKRPGRYQSDFIWNTDWQSQLDREAAEAAKKHSIAASSPAQPSGGLGLARVQDLNRMDIDFSEQLKKRHMEPASSSLSSDSRNMATGQVKPTQADSRRWERSGRFRSRVVAAPLEDAELQVKAEEEKASYEQLKLELQVWTIAVSVFGFGASWLAYSQDVAVSYAVGAVGSFIYLRMLHRSVDSVAGGGIAGAIGQQRLLIPLILALSYNRWNQLKAEETGIILQFLPMLLGFFTYKAAVAGKQAATLLGELAASASPKRA